MSCYANQLGSLPTTHLEVAESLLRTGHRGSKSWVGHAELPEGLGGAGGVWGVQGHKGVWSIWRQILCTQHEQM